MIKIVGMPRANIDIQTSNDPPYRKSGGDFTPIAWALMTISIILYLMFK